MRGKIIDMKRRLIMSKEIVCFMLVITLLFGLSTVCYAEDFPNSIITGRVAGKRSISKHLDLW